MDFGSIRRKNRVSQPSSRRKTVSSSNLSCISCNSASVARKTVYVTLPKEFGCDVNLEGKIVQMRRGGPAHAVGIIQIGDYIRIVDDSRDNGSNNGGSECGDNSNVVKLQITFGILQVDMRPNYPLIVEIGNRSHTSLGIALADSSDGKIILISSIQPGSLADRCGFLNEGDVLTSIYINDENIPCSPFYNSYQIAQILRQLTSKMSSIKLTIVPCSPHQIVQQVQCHNLPNCSTEDIDIHSSDSTLTLGESDSSNNSLHGYHNNNHHHHPNCGGIGCSNNSGGLTSNSTFMNGKSFRQHSPSPCSSLHFHLPKRQIEKVDEQEEEQFCSGVGGEDNCFLLSLCLWKDPLYEDWGFSLVDETLENVEEEGTDVECCDAGDTSYSSSQAAQINTKSSLLGNTREKTNKHERRQGGAYVGDIRLGGPAYVGGLQPSDRIVEINGQDVSKLESILVVPILASLEHALNLVIIRDPNSSSLNE